MTIQNALNNRLFYRLNIVTFDSSGIYTPGNAVVAVEVICTGGGGGSGGTEDTAGAEVVASGNGGGGGVTKRFYTRGDLLPSVSVTVGAQGPGGAVGVNAGGNGGTTQFLGMNAGGGNGSPGGNRTNGSLQIAGQNGGTAIGGQLNIVCPTSAPRGIMNSSPVYPLYADPAIPITGFGRGAVGNIFGHFSPAAEGQPGQAGQVTIIEYLGV